MLTGLTGRPVLGVLPWREGLGLDMEDSLALDAARPAMAARGGPGRTSGRSAKKFSG